MMLTAADFPTANVLKCCGRYSQLLNVMKYRSSCPEVFCKKGVLGNFTKSTRKHLSQSLFFNKVAAANTFPAMGVSFYPN